MIRHGVVTLVVVVITYCCGSVCASEEPTGKNKNNEKTPGQTFLEGWAGIEKPVTNTPPHSEWGESSNGLRACTAAVNKLLEKEMLSSNSNMYCEFTPGSIPNYKIISARGSAADRFKYEQAIWECAPFLGVLANPKGVSEFKPLPSAKLSEGEKKFFEHHPELGRNSVLIHVVPRRISDYARFADTFTEASLDQEQNIRVIPLQKIASLDLRKFRTEWITFTSKWPRSTSRQQILDFAAHLLNKYPSLFGN